MLPTAGDPVRATPETPATTGSAARRSLAAVLLAAELIETTVLYDTDGFRGVAGWLDALVASTAPLLQMAIAAATAAVLLAGPRRGERGRPLDEGPDPGRIPLATLVVHLAVFAGFLVVTGLLFERRPPDPGTPPAGLGAVALWGALGAATLATGLAVAVPLASWTPLARRAAVPMLLGLAVGVVATLAGWGTARFWGPLGRSTLWSVHTLLGATGEPRVYIPSRAILGTWRFPVTVGAECSGFEGFGLLWVLLVAALARSRHRPWWPRALGAVLLGTLALWAINVARMALLLLLGTYASPRLAIQGFHSKGTWLLINALALGFAALVLRPRPIRAGAGP